MKELAEDIRVCFFTTHLDEAPLQTRPMTAREVDEEGNIWFFSDEASNKNFEIEDDARVQLFFGHPSKTEFLTVYGHAMVNRDRKKIEDLWHPMAKAWFTDKDDPTLTLIMVSPDHAYYWDTKSNRMISLLKILKSTVSDKTNEDGVEGTLKI